MSMHSRTGKSHKFPEIVISTHNLVSSEVDLSFMKGLEYSSGSCLIFTTDSSFYDSHDLYSTSTVCKVKLLTFYFIKQHTWVLLGLVIFFYFYFMNKNFDYLRLIRHECRTYGSPFSPIHDFGVDISSQLVGYGFVKSKKPTLMTEFIDCLCKFQG